MEQPADDIEEQAEQIEQHLKGAIAALPPATEHGHVLELLDEGELDRAFVELRELAKTNPVPLQFWFEMSRAGDLLGGEFSR